MKYKNSHIIAHFKVCTRDWTSEKIAGIKLKLSSKRGKLIADCSTPEACLGGS